MGQLMILHLPKKSLIWQKMIMHRYLCSSKNSAKKGTLLSFMTMQESNKTVEVDNKNTVLVLIVRLTVVAAL